MSDELKSDAVLGRCMDCGRVSCADGWVCFDCFCGSYGYDAEKRHALKALLVRAEELRRGAEAQAERWLAERDVWRIRAETAEALLAQRTETTG